MLETLKSLICTYVDADAASITPESRFADD